MHKAFHNREGFTLVELLVSLSLFSVIVTIAIGGFASGLRTQRQAVALISANNNVSIVFEQLVREIRNGKSFGCGSSCAELSFINQYERLISYRLIGERIERSEEQDDGSFTQGFMTSANVRVNYLRFALTGAENDNLQPRVTVMAGVSPRGDNTVVSSEIKIQTTVSSRQEEKY